MLERGAAFALDLGLNPTLQLGVAGESVPLKSSISGALVHSVLGMICLDRCTEIRRLCITVEVDEDVSGLGIGKARLVVDNTPLLGRVDGPNI